MKAIVISPEEFLVNTHGIKAMISDKIVLIHTKNVETVDTFHGGTTENVPAFSFKNEKFWEEASKNNSVIELDSDKELHRLYCIVHYAYEDQFESEQDFLFSHVNDFPWNN